MTDARTLDVVLRLDSEAMAARVAQALAVETSDAPPRTRVEVSARGAELVLRFEAEETRALRAAANSFLRWADAAVAVARLASDRRA